MNNKERLKCHFRMYSLIKEQASKNKRLYWVSEEDTNQTDWEIIENVYPEIIIFIDYLLSNLKSFNKREQELFNVENCILWIDYRDYKLKVLLDAERDCLVGEVEGINGEYDSDSLTHLKEQLERAVDEEIGYTCQSQLAERNNELAKQVIELKAEVEKYKSLTNSYE